MVLAENSIAAAKVILGSAYGVKSLVWGFTMTPQELMGWSGAVAAFGMSLASVYDKWLTNKNKAEADRIKSLEGTSAKLLEEERAARAIERTMAQADRARLSAEITQLRAELEEMREVVTHLTRSFTMGHSNEASKADGPGSVQG